MIQITIFFLLALTSCIDNSHEATKTKGPKPFGQKIKWEIDIDDLENIHSKIERSFWLLYITLKIESILGLGTLFFIS